MNEIVQQKLIITKTNNYCVSIITTLIKEAIHIPYTIFLYDHECNAYLTL